MIYILSLLVFFTATVQAGTALIYDDLSTHVQSDTFTSDRSLQPNPQICRDSAYKLLSQIQHRASAAQQLGGMQASITFLTEYAHTMHTRIDVTQQIPQASPFEDGEIVFMISHRGLGLVPAHRVSAETDDCIIS